MSEAGTTSRRMMISAGMALIAVLLAGATALLVGPYCTIVESVNRRDGAARIRTTYFGFLVWQDLLYWSPLQAAGYGELRAEDRDLVIAKKSARFPWNDPVVEAVDSLRADEAKLFLRLLSINELIKGHENKQWKVPDDVVVGVIVEHIELWNGWSGGIPDPVVDKIIQNIETLEGKSKKPVR